MLDSMPSQHSAQASAEASSGRRNQRPRLARLIMPGSKHSISSSPFLYFESGESALSSSTKSHAQSAARPSSRFFPNLTLNTEYTVSLRRHSINSPYSATSSYSQVDALGQEVSRRASSVSAHSSTFGPAPLASHWSDDSEDEDDDGEDDGQWSPGATPISPLFREAWESVVRRAKQSQALSPTSPNNKHSSLFRMSTGASVPPRMPSFLQALSPLSKVPLIPTSSPSHRNPPPQRPPRPSTLYSANNKSNLAAWKIAENNESSDATLKSDHEGDGSQASTKVPTTTPSHTKTLSFLDLEASPASPAPTNFLDLDSDNSPGAASRASADAAALSPTRDRAASTRFVGSGDWPNYGYFKGLDAKALGAQSQGAATSVGKAEKVRRGQSFLVLTPISTTGLPFPVLPPATQKTAEQRRGPANDVIHQFRHWQGFASSGPGAQGVAK